MVQPTLIVLFSFAYVINVDFLFIHVFGWFMTKFSIIMLTPIHPWSLPTDSIWGFYATDPEA